MTGFEMQQAQLEAHLKVSDRLLKAEEQIARLQNRIGKLEKALTGPKGEPEQPKQSAAKHFTRVIFPTGDQSTHVG